MQAAQPGDGAPPPAGPAQIFTAAVALADLEGGARSTSGAASCDVIFLSAAALVLICLAAAFFAAFFAALLASYLSTILSATFNAHLAASLLLMFRKFFGTSKVPNLLCWAKTRWSCRGERWRKCARQMRGSDG